MLNKINNLFIHIFLFSLSIFSIFTLKIFGGMDLRIFDFAFLFYFLILLYILFLSNKKVEVNDLSIVFIVLLIHIMLLFFYPFLGIFFKYRLDVGLILRWLEIFIFIGVFILLFKVDNNYLRTIRNGLLLIGVINFVYALAMIVESQSIFSFEFLPHHSISESTIWKFEDSSRIPALFSNPNQLGWYSFFILMLTFGIYFDDRFKFDKNWIIIFIIHFLLLVFSTSRTTQILFIGNSTFIVCFFTFIAILKYNFESRSIYLFLTIVFLVFMTFFIGNSYDIFRFDTLERAIKMIVDMDPSMDSSFYKRIVNWSSVLTYFFTEEYPFGTMVAPSYKIGTIDSGWISYFVQSGIILICSFLIMFGIIIIKSFYELRQNKRFYLNLIIIQISISLMIGSIVMSPFHYLIVLFLFIIILKLNTYQKFKGNT